MMNYRRHPTGAFDNGFRCGDEVHLADDPAHIGRVDAIISGVVKVVWKDTGWIEYQPNAANLVLHRPAGMTSTAALVAAHKDELPTFADDSNANEVLRKSRRMVLPTKGRK
jgi:hypothetical protein